MWRAFAAADGLRDLRATRHGTPTLNLRSLRQHQRVFGVHAEIAHRALKLRVPERDLHCSQVAYPLVDQRHFRPA